MAYPALSAGRPGREGRMRAIDTEKPMPYSVVVFRDPDNIRLELFHMAG